MIWHILQIYYRMEMFIISQTLNLWQRSLSVFQDLSEVCVCVHRELEDSFDCQSNDTIHLVFWDRFSHWPWAHQLDWLARESKCLSTFVSLVLRLQVFTTMSCFLKCGFWASNSGPPILWGKATALWTELSSQLSSASLYGQTSLTRLLFKAGTPLNLWYLWN